LKIAASTHGRCFIVGFAKNKIATKNIKNKITATTPKRHHVPRAAQPHKKKQSNRHVPNQSNHNNNNHVRQSISIWTVKETSTT
jgi:hypothetical protein